MKTIVDWFARNAVASNLLMLSLILGGGLTMANIKMELFPEFSLDRVTVQVPFPGAAPEEIEEAICIKIEEEVYAIDGIKKITSTAVENIGTVSIEVATGVDPRRVLDDVKARVDSIDTFPDGAEKPVILEVLMRTQVINVAAYGDVDEHTLKALGTRVRDDINNLEGVSQVELVNVRPYEISIELSELAMRELELTFDDVARAVRNSSLDLTGGSIKSDRGEMLLRTDSQAYRGEEFEALVIRTNTDGSRVTLGQIATVVDGFEDLDQSSKFEGKPSVMVQVFRVGDESALAIAEQVHAYVAKINETLPEGVCVETWQDASVWLKGRLDLLLKNGAQGLVLVFIILALFLRFRLSFWVTLGIPISFFGAVMVMPGLDQSINMLSLFAFILVLGIVVDDAIVVGESVHKEHESGYAGVDGAVRGVRSVAVPVVFAVLTTVVAFLPMGFLPGTFGKYFEVIPAAVIPALLFSLVESQLVLPAHLTHEGGIADRISCYWPFKGWVLLQRAFGNAMDFVINRVYEPAQTVALNWRYATLAVAIATLVITGAFVASGKMKFVFFPDIEGDVAAAQLTMPQGTSATTTARAVRRIEEAANQIMLEYQAPGSGESIVRAFMASVGEQPFLAQQRQGQGGGGNITGPQFGEVVLELVPAENRTVSANDLIKRWRELVGEIPGAVNLDFGAAIMSSGPPINFQLSGQDIRELQQASTALRNEIERYPGVFDVSDSFRGGKQELVFDVLPSAEALGITRLDLARQIRQGFYGEEVQRIQRGRDDVKVMIRYPSADRRSIQGIESIRIRTKDGMEMPFSSVARVKSRQGFATISRSNRARTVNVMGDVDTTFSTPSEIMEALESDVMPGLLETHPGVTIAREGQASDQIEFIQAMIKMYIFAMFAVYALMAIPFKSYFQPLIVMLAIPFGVVGAVWGHVIVGYDLSVLSVLGIAALAGVVVNDSLVLVDFVNRKKAEGLSTVQAAKTAGVARFRPILLTSMTTFAGLTPLILERSVQAQFLIPMALSLAFGVMFSTAVSLVLVPCGYVILDDLGNILGHIKHAWNWLYPGLAAKDHASDRLSSKVHRS